MFEELKINLQLFAEEGIDDNDITGQDIEGDEGNLDDDTQIEDNQQNNQQDDQSQHQQVQIPDGFIPKDQVSKIVSERVNQINQKYRDYDQMKQTMEKLIAMSGLTPEQFYAQLEQLELQSQAQQLGVSPEIAKQLQASKRAAEEAHRAAMDMKYQMEEITLKQNPLYSDYDKVKDEVRQFAEKTGTSLEQSYWALYGKDLVKKESQMAEFRAQHNQTYKQQRAGVEHDGGDKSPTPPGAKLDNLQRSFAKKLGMSEDEYAIYNDDNLTYDQILAMKNKK